MKNHPLVFAALTLIVVFASAGFAQSLLAAATTIGTNIVTTGSIGIGTASPLTKLHVGNGTTNNSSDSQILISRAVDDSVSGNGHAFSDSSNVSRSGTIGYNSYDARITISGSNNFDHYAGFQSLPSYDGLGAMANYYGMYSGLTINSGTINNSYGTYVGNPSGAGTVTNNYGLYIADMAKGSAANYAIYTAGTATSSFGGFVGIGTSVPAYKLDVNGIVSTAPAGTGGFYFGTRGKIIQDTSYNWLFSTNSVANALAIQSSTGNFGIGTTSPAVKLQITPGSNTEPMTPGTASGGFALTSSTGLFGLYAGVRSSGSAWFQSGRIDGSSSVYNILLQPNGGNIGIGTTTPTAQLQVTNASANATTTVEIGKTGQNKGSCLKMYDETGAVKYVTIRAGSFVISDASCQ